jgi:CHAD domain-containing protein
MAYRFRAGDRSVERAVRRIAREQVDSALSAIGTKSSDVATHEVRKACKKVRALVRLVRPGFEDYARENAEFRDIAGGLAGARDAKVLLDTFDLLIADAPEGTDPALFAPLREAIAPELTDKGGGQSEEARLEEARVLLEAARKRIGNWTLAREEWDALGPGLIRILRKAQAAAGAALQEPSALNYHELRKLMKYHWYHTRLLTPVWPEMMEPRAAELSRLADVLGLHHDICVFEERLRNLPAGTGHGADYNADYNKATRALGKLAGKRRVKLERESAPLTQRLLAQQPDALADHWQALWRIWRAGAGEKREKRHGD